MDGILDGIRVIDLSRYIAGPYCAQLLADMGAEVIKIEKPGAGDITRTVGPWKNGVGLSFPACNRNKKSVTADLRKPDGLALAKRLIAKSDVLLDNFRAGTMEKMGLGYDVVKALNPSIIMVSVTGFGQSGPLKDRLAFDGIISALSGVTRIENESVERSKGPLHDYMAAMNATIGILAAIYDRSRTGKGQRLDVSMLAGSSMIRSISVADASVNGEEAAIVNDDAAPYGYLRATDGWVNFHAGPDPVYQNLLGLIDDPVLHEPKYADLSTRVANAGLLFDIIQKWAADKSCDELEAIFTQHQIPSGTVATPGRILNNPHLNAEGYIVSIPVEGIGDTAFVGFPFKMSERPITRYASPPGIGEHNDEIYKGVLELGDNELEALMADGVI